MASAPPARTAPPVAVTLDYAQATPALPPTHPLPTRDYQARTVWRCHRMDPATGLYRSTVFNSGGRGDARFSPIFDSTGAVIPTLYAATEARAAIAEVLLHDMPSPSTGAIFDATHAMLPSEGNMVSSVEVPALTLVPLTSFGLQAVGLTVPDLIGGNSVRYPHTRAWARWIHENMPSVQGLYWMSRRDDENGCMVLFGDRIPSGLTELTREPLRAYRLELFEALDAMGAVGI
ncbi:RES family NAD+ phosphorylase [Pelomonas cellulosilytica]|uniref:RES family NAD+ phosphorylase n=1 Tax=Pelomonas cellulosilytica TaxID=2906762 RepID=A0ABS8Y4F7_9BURK|nr:RES family NAD+ phosphorylase [Pelomonas sp. P8]MCE4558181.1 RES family NAD+ phosphorylase [Pelomonas sp. P8]